MRSLLMHMLCLNVCIICHLPAVVVGPLPCIGVVVVGGFSAGVVVVGSMGVVGCSLACGRAGCHNLRYMSHHCRLIITHLKFDNIQGKET